MNTINIIKANMSRRKKDGWKCTICNKIFLTKKLLYEHKHEEHNTKRQIKNNIWTCKYCNCKTDTRKELFEHYKVCKIKKSFPTDSKGRTISNEVVNGHKTQGEKLSKKYKDGLIKYPLLSYSENWTSELRANQALIMQNYRKSINTLHKANVSNKACDYIDNLNKIKGWNLKHGRNGEEKQIGPYFVDGYDYKRNIVFEYDEVEHNKPKRKKKDILRQEYIIKMLNCEFWRYDEKTDTLYKIN